MDMGTADPSVADEEQLLRVPAHHLTPYVAKSGGGGGGGSGTFGSESRPRGGEEIHLFHLRPDDYARRAQAVENYRSVTQETRRIADAKLQLDRTDREARAAIIRAALQKGWLLREKEMTRRKDAVLRRRRVAHETQLLKRRLAEKKVDPLDRDQSALAGMIRVEFKQANRRTRQQQQQQQQQQKSWHIASTYSRQHASPRFYNEESTRLLRKVLQQQQQQQQQPAAAEQQQDQPRSSGREQVVSIPGIIAGLPEQSCYFIPDALGGGGQFVPVAAMELEPGIPSPTMSRGQEKFQSGVLDVSEAVPTASSLSPQRRPNTVPHNISQSRPMMKSSSPPVGSPEQPPQEQRLQQQQQQQILEDKAEQATEPQQLQTRQQQPSPQPQQQPGLSPLLPSPPALGTRFPKNSNNPTNQQQNEDTLRARNPRVHVRGPGGFRAPKTVSSSCRVISSNTSVKMVSLAPRRPSQPAAVASNRSSNSWRRRVASGKIGVSRVRGRMAPPPNTRRNNYYRGAKQTLVQKPTLAPFCGDGDNKLKKDKARAKKKKDQIRKARAKQWLPLETPRPVRAKSAKAANWSSALCDGRDFVLGRTQMNLLV
jgi:hypothetical protein